MGGCVENSLPIRSRELNGLAIIRCAWVGDLRRRWQRGLLHSPADLAQCRRQRQRISGELGAGLIGLVLPRARHRHPDHARRNRTEKGNQQHRQRVHTAAVAVSAAGVAGEHGHVGQVGDHRGHRAGHTRDQDVAVVDMGEFVTQNGAQFALVEDVEDAGRAADRGVARVAAGGKRVGVGGVTDVEPRHRLVRGGGQFPDHRVDLRRLHLGDRLGVHGFQCHLVAVEIHVGVHADGDEQGQEHHVAPEQ